MGVGALTAGLFLRQPALPCTCHLMSRNGGVDGGGSPGTVQGAPLTPVAQGIPRVLEALCQEPGTPTSCASGVSQRH